MHFGFGVLDQKLEDLAKDSFKLIGRGFEKLTQCRVQQLFLKDIGVFMELLLVFCKSLYILQKLRNGLLGPRNN